MKWKEIVNDYLSFTRKERIGIITILIIIVLAVLLPIFFSQNDVTSEHTPDSKWITAVKELENKQAYKRNDVSEKEVNIEDYQYDQSEKNYYVGNKPREVFYFDPNTLSENGWQRLGLHKKTIKTIQNYLGKGGRFKKADDLRRIYGLHKNDFERIAPYVKFEQEVTEIKTGNFIENKNLTENHSFPKKSSRYNILDINKADTTAFISLPGIGSKLASRIVNFRDKLGGFYAVEQVKETFGLPDSTFQRIKEYLKLEDHSLRKININTATVDELKLHPYIKNTIANAIIVYRNEHGIFVSIDDLKKIMVITDDIYRKIIPYLATQ